MNLEDKITIVKDGIDVLCDVVFDFTCDQNGRAYVAFTDHSVDELGNENIYVKSYDPFDKEVKLEDVETDAEWQMVSDVLNSIKNGEV